ncbi:putative L1 late protein [Equus caballus papillomavirus 6]|uniref:Major capsid protein L1 n=1 Tax=Equus caballus papillomavirus 6 TaxID=1235427 RepID=M4HXD5_9PAPI|nr:putative L1 late protein [Equus caballus papillomavirus 6]AFU07684.1 putative L1 late protein [Equus caballus papillomavirus 6]
MSYWRSNTQKLFLPPTPSSRVPHTDEYVTRTDLFYYGCSERLLTVGHPYYRQPYKNIERKADVPKVSPYQYRVFKVTLPNPNRFAFPDSGFFDPDNERLVWAVVGLEVSRGQPLGIGLSGHVLYNKLDDVENQAIAQRPGEFQHNRVNLAHDNKQSQLLIVGCKPALGEYWDKAEPCQDQAGDTTKCPPIELKSEDILDGTMIDTGYGAMNFKTLHANKSDVPLDIVDSICMYPDYLQMAKEPSGDRLFFCSAREQMYVRHFLSRDGNNKEAIPEELLFQSAAKTLSTSVYSGTPSGSLVSTETNIFNKPYWLQRAQGQNNGICWHDQLFVTTVDTTRGTSFTINVQTDSSKEYDANKFNEYLRHVEEFELEFMFQLCKVKLTAENLAHLTALDSTILEDWELGLSQGTTGLESTYRYLSSLATKCPVPAPAQEPEKPYRKGFWVVDLQQRLTLDIDQFPLGRRFLAHRRLLRTTRPLKRAATASRNTKGTPKRRRK